MSFYSTFADYYESVFPFKQATFDFLESHLRGDNPRILDVGCGTGLYTARFAEAGVDATGIDLDTEMIRYAEMHYRNASFFRMNMTEAGTLDGGFSLAYSIGNVVSHLSRDQLSGFLDSLSEVLLAGGHWVFQIVNWDFIMKQAEYEFPVKSIDGGKMEFFREYTHISDTTVTFKTTLRSDDKVVFDEESVLHPITSEDYISLHHNAGYRLTSHYCDYNLTAYEPDFDKANIMVFQKE